MQSLQSNVHRLLFALRYNNEHYCTATTRHTTLCQLKSCQLLH